MSCILRFSASNCDIDAIATNSALPIDSLYRQGELHNAKRPERGALEKSGFQIVASEASFEQFKQQVADTIEFIKAHHTALQQLAAVAENLVDCQFLFDFGINTRMFDVAAQMDYFPPELIRLVGSLNAGIELSQYPPPAEDEQ